MTAKLVLISSVCSSTMANKVPDAVTGVHMGNVGIKDMLFGEIRVLGCREICTGVVLAVTTMGGKSDEPSSRSCNVDGSVRWHECVRGDHLLHWV